MPRVDEEVREVYCVVCRKRAPLFETLTTKQRVNLRAWAMWLDPIPGWRDVMVEPPRYACPGCAAEIEVAIDVLKAERVAG